MKDYGTYSFWLENAGDDLTPRPALDGSISVDVAILGAGFTGLWTAYHLLEREGVIRDVVRANHSGTAPSFLGTCKVDGAETQGEVFAILEMGAASSLHARIAWHIDEAKASFVGMDTANLICPRTGIATSDGGR